MAYADNFAELFESVEGAEYRGAIHSAGVSLEARHRWPTPIVDDAGVVSEADKHDASCAFGF
jgi:hypothetical protein